MNKIQELLVKESDREANDEGRWLWSHPKRYPRGAGWIRTQDIRWNWTLFSLAFGMEINYDLVNHSLYMVVSLGVFHISYETRMVKV